MALKIDLRVGETLQVGEARLKLVRKAGQVATLVIDAPREMKITSQNPLIKEPNREVG
ncbi:carbon storage regulator [Martelella sp. AD-3]|uniref:carbon storage regulator n=1 Tax=Martelella sp. AD-3 TaxID=686597 RepID=UPI000AEFA965|nr:carbon storage regulator [Martelella sp. AD-3]